MKIEEKRQLLMRFPAEKLVLLAEPELPPEFELRPYRDGDTAFYLRLMQRVGFEWRLESVQEVCRAALSGGIWFVVRSADDVPVATAMANRNAPAGCGDGGELGWVGVDPEFRGRHLGELVCRRVLCHFREAGYRRIYLLTDDFRLPALATYLRSGWEPVCSDESDKMRWDVVADLLRTGA